MRATNEKFDSVTIEAEDDLDRTFLQLIGATVSPRLTATKNCPGEYVEYTFRFEFKSGRGTYNPKTRRVEK